jgi:uncharacterized membrane protein
MHVEASEVEFRIVPNRLRSVLCYLLGPAGGWYFLSHSVYRNVWAVRFHACHSLLLSSVFICGWLLLSIAQTLTPWFISNLFREMRLIGMLGSLPVWVIAMIAAYRGDRFIAIPVIHELAVKFARHVEHTAEQH